MNSRDFVGCPELSIAKYDSTNVSNELLFWWKTTYLATEHLRLSIINNNLYQGWAIKTTQL